MFKLSFIIIILSFVSIKCNNTQFETNLELVQILFRHGDRTPVNIYPNSINKASVWEKYGGLGQLTQTGMKRHFNYGLYLKSIYKNFLSDHYDRREVNVYSTDTDRTIMSVLSLLSGLYEPSGYQVWNSNINWQPIPVHTSKIGDDKVNNLIKKFRFIIS
jgi:hypothetical protein